MVKSRLAEMLLEKLYMLYGIWNEQYWRFFVKTVPVFIKMSGVRQLEHKQNEGSVGDRKSILF
jgi:hypothetical protein